MNMITRFRVIVAVALVMAIPCGVHAADDEPRIKQFAPEARSLFTEIAAAYRAFSGADIEGKLTTDVTVDGRTRRRTSRTLLRYDRPNKLVLANGPARIVCDGTTLHSVFEVYRQYAVADTPTTVGSSTLRGNPLAGPLCGGIEGFPLFLLLELVSEKDADKVLTLGACGLVLEDDREVDGVKLRSLLVDWPKGTGFRLLVDPVNKRIQRIEMMHALELANAEAPPQAPKLDALSVVWTATTIDVAEKPADDKFAYTPPDGYAKVELAALLDRPLRLGEVRMPAQVDEHVMREMEAARSMVGKAAPGFDVTVLDEAGKESALAKSDLEGRVAAIVVWPGSLDEPFPGQLAGLVEMATAYREAKAGVAVVFLLHDNLPDAATAMRAQVERSLEKHKLKLPVGQQRLIAIDPELSVSRAFHATALPMVAILDTRGVVRAIHIGFMEEHASVIKRDVDKLLASPATEPVDMPESGK